MKELMSSIADWMDALKKWAGIAGHSTLQSLKGSMEETGKSATQLGMTAGAALAAVGLVLITVSAAIAGLLMLGGLAAIWAVCIATAFMALVSGLLAWMFWNKVRGSVKNAATLPQDNIATLPQLPRLDAFVSIPSLFPKPNTEPLLHKQITITTTPEPNNMNTKQIQGDIKSFTRDISSTVESFLADNLGNTLNDVLKSAWKWAQKNPIPAVLLGASAGGAAILATVRSGSDVKGTVRFGGGKLTANVDDDGFVNRLTGVVHSTIDSLTGRARNGAAAARDAATDVSRTATKTAHRVADYARDRAEDVTDWASDAASKARSAASDLRDGAENAWDKSASYAKKNPATAAAGLIAVGLIAGFLINASRKDS